MKLTFLLDKDLSCESKKIKYREGATISNHKKVFQIIATIMIKVLASALTVYFVDATVQIDDDYGVLAVLLILENLVIGYVAF